MKPRMILLFPLTLVLVIGADALLAQEKPRDDAARSRRGGLREKFLKEFDKDGDGKLSAEERAAAREAMRSRRGRPGGGPGRPPVGRELALLLRFDANKDLKLDDEEKAAARKAFEDQLAQANALGAKLLKEFDEDGDGKLNEQEMAKARKLMQRRRADRPGGQIPKKMLEEFDKDGDGKLNEEERAAAREAMKERTKTRRAEFLKKYDKDGDGRLSPEEREAARKELRERAGGGGRPGERRRRPRREE